MREINFEKQKVQGIIPADTKLTERSPGIPAWDSLDADHQKLYSYMTEVYAAALSYADN
jgi:arylsulfatase